MIAENLTAVLRSIDRHGHDRQLKVVATRIRFAMKPASLSNTQGRQRMGIFRNKATSSAATEQPFTAPVMLPPPAIYTTEEQLMTALDEVGEFQRRVTEGSPDLEYLQLVGQEITARLQGVAEYVLRNGGSLTLHSTIVEPIGLWAMGTLGPMWIVDQAATPTSAAVKKAYYEIMEFHQNYDFLRDTGGRPR